MGVPAHGAAALCMPGEKTGNKYAVSQYSAGFPQHRILRSHPDPDKIQTKRGIFSDDDSDDDDHDDSQRERTRTVPYCPGGLFGVLNCCQFSPPSHRHQHISQLIIRPSAASSPRSSPQEARAAKGNPSPRWRGGQRLQKNTCGEQHLIETALSVLQRRRSPPHRPGHRPQRRAHPSLARA